MDQATGNPLLFYGAKNQGITNSRPASQEISRLLRNLQVHYCVDTSR
jgi:hypothetical protein